jgi:hypothetical protein
LHRPKTDRRLKIKGEMKEEAGVQTAATYREEIMNKTNTV